jgi:hypothetical protein
MSWCIVIESIFESHVSRVTNDECMFISKISAYKCEKMIKWSFSA